MSDRRAIVSEGAPAPIGPYSQAVACGDLVACSGQVGLDPASGSLVAGGVVPEAERALLNLTAVLAAAGCTPADVVRTTVYLVDMADFPAVNEVYARTFAASSAGPAPARATVAVAALPKAARIEIDALAVRRRPPLQAGASER